MLPPVPHFDRISIINHTKHEHDENTTILHRKQNRKTIKFISRERNKQQFNITKTVAQDILQHNNK